MNVKSMFEFKFPAAAREEGIGLAQGIGGDMPSKEGYVSHEVVQDVTDPGHLTVTTLWSSNEQADAVLAAYNNDAKVKRATALIGAPPTGFVGSILSSSS